MKTKKEKVIKAWMSRGELTTAIKNNGLPSKRDIADDYGCVWFAKNEIPDRRGMIEVSIIYQPL